MKDSNIQNEIPFICTSKGLISTQYILEKKAQGLLNTDKLYKSPISITLEMTSKCNFKCLHCYNDSGKKTLHELNDKQWINLCAQIKEMKIFECVISGGEPLLEISKIQSVMDELYHSGISLQLNTNGSLLSIEFLEQIKKYNLSHIQISIDGARPQTHNLIRGVECWNKVINAADLVVSSGIPLVFAYVINRLNYNEIEEMSENAYIMGASKLVFTFYEPVGRAKDNENKLLLLIEEKKLLYSRLRKIYDKYINKMEIQILPERRLNFQLQLRGGNDNLVIDACGNLKINCFLPLYLGNINELSLKEWWESVGMHAWHSKEVLNCLEEINYG